MEWCVGGRVVGWFEMMLMSKDEMEEYVGVYD